MKIKAIIHKETAGGYRAEVPALQGCFSEGDTMEEIVANIREAAEGWLEVASEQAEEEAATKAAAQVVEIEL